VQSMDSITSRIKLGAHSLDVYLAFDKDAGISLKHVEGVACCSDKHGREGRREGVRSSRSTSMLDDIYRSGAESTTCTKIFRKRADQHINLGGIDVLSFGQLGLVRPITPKDYVSSNIRRNLHWSLSLT
jgi:hypothetical protein